MTVLGLALLVMSVTGFTRTLQRTFVAAWDLPRPGLFAFGRGVLGAAVLAAGVVAGRARHAAGRRRRGRRRAQAVSYTASAQMTATQSAIITRDQTG